MAGYHPVALLGDIIVPVAAVWHRPLIQMHVTHVSTFVFKIFLLIVY